MKIEEDVPVTTSKLVMRLFVISDVILVILSVVAYKTDDERYAMFIIICAPLILIQLCMLVGWIFRNLVSLLNFIMDPFISFFSGIGKQTRAHLSRHKELEPMSSYDSLQARAKGFIKLAIPADIKLEKYSFANKCIKTYAKNGEISLTEKERSKLSLVILETGISSQEPGDKSYYERERVAVLENILSEKHGN